jgi:hypothetical protein
MTAQQLIDLIAGIPTIIAAITALILALRGNGTAKTNQALLMAHLTSLAHPSDVPPVAPIPPDSLN